MLVEVYKRGCLFNDRFVDYTETAEILKQNRITSIIERGLLNFCVFYWVIPNNMTNKVLLTVFSMLAELERDFISERTKEGLHTLKAKGIMLGKPRGTVQTSMYDKDKEKIFHLYKLGVPIREIINKHLKYGKYLSLMNYVKKRYDED